MHAAVVSSFDVSPAYKSFVDPVAQDGEKLVRVKAAALHQIVRSLANGSHYASSGELPFVAGVDGVGTLEDGLRIYFGVARSPFGTMAELALAPEWMCIPLPNGLDDVTAAGIANPALSSSVALKHRAKFVAGESVFVLGATGTSGKLAVQVAKRLGARRVIAAGRNAEELERLKDLGADMVVSLEQERGALIENLRSVWADGGVDVVLDYLWGQPAEIVLQAIAKKGLRTASPRVRYVQIGGSAGPNISLSAMTLRSSGLELLGSGFGSASMKEISTALTEFFAEAAEKPYVFATQTASLRDVETVWKQREGRARIVFQP